MQIATPAERTTFYTETSINNIVTANSLTIQMIDLQNEISIEKFETLSKLRPQICGKKPDRENIDPTKWVNKWFSSRSSL